MTVEVVHWNPRLRVVPGPIGKVVPLRKPPVNNFGDLLGPRLVDRVAEERGLALGDGQGRLLAVGSILHLAEPNNVVWGTGANGKKRLDQAKISTLDFRAVRGPFTQRLVSELGADVPEVYGDPGLLWSRYWPRETYATDTVRRVGIVPNLHDWHYYRSDPRAICPIGDPHEVISEIAKCELVVATSLHGIVIAESFGIPARLIPPVTEPMHKYIDYYGGTGRGMEPAVTVEHAVEIGGQRLGDWDPEPLINAFPVDLWQVKA